MGHWRISMWRRKLPDNVGYLRSRRRTLKSLVFDPQESKSHAGNDQYMDHVMKETSETMRTEAQKKTDRKAKLAEALRKK